MTSTAPTPSRGNPAALARARAEASARKRRDVVATLHAAADRGQALTVSTLAASAGVSRQVLYSQPDIMGGLRRHQERYPAAGDRPLHAARAADLVNAQDTIKRLKGEARELNRRLEAGLAAQLELRMRRGCVSSMSIAAMRSNDSSPRTPTCSASSRNCANKSVVSRTIS
ncbi:hypothetical protein [Microbacterium rhizomatis]|uniref:Transposase n=1 Tax=Microbacterium rhizomatis TaxID=1631477 RepID=A0A5J5IZ78_9MICO|nr:hypothetical protein [Microbacterium rhizomatis]KAA9104777.1 hypothetical protein F6B43_19065 [Microbacterium rhizomatis]